MTNDKYIHLQDDDEWYTPKWIVETLGKFDYDPATNSRKAADFGIVHYDTIETDGLKQDWSKYKKYG